MGCPIAKLDSLRKRTALIPLLTVAIGFFLIGCIPVTGEVGEVQAVFPCDRLGMSHWEEFDFGPVSSLDGFLATVDQLYGVDSDVLHSIKSPEGQVTEVNWTDSNSGLAANFFWRWATGGHSSAMGPRAAYFGPSHKLFGSSRHPDRSHHQ